jgi:diguanylate cyclase (GGDEF)-like protein
LLIDRIFALLSQGEKGGEYVGVVLMDIDNFKQVNETYGYDEGDGVMREIARRMKNAILAGNSRPDERRRLPPLDERDTAN